MNTEHEEGCACCEHGEDAVADMIEQAIKNVGFALIALPPSDTHPTFVYTVGLSRKLLPELCLTNIPMAVASKIVGQMAHEFLVGNLTEDHIGDRLVGFANEPLVMTRVYPVTPGGMQFFGWVPRFLETVEQIENLKLVQIVCPDIKGRYPGDEGYEVCQALLPTEPAPLPIVVNPEHPDHPDNKPPAVLH